MRLLETIPTSVVKDERISAKERLEWLCAGDNLETGRTSLKSFNLLMAFDGGRGAGSMIHS